jgi:hypothetical protein
MSQGNLQLSVVFLLLLLGCSGDKNSPVPSLPVPPATISPQESNIVVDKTLKMSAVGLTSAGTSGGVSVISWDSDDDEIATIDANGVVLGRKLGIITVSAKTNDFSATAKVGIVSASAGGADFGVSGFALYEDKPFTQSGFTGTLVQTPIRHAIIQLVAIDGFTVLASGVTGEDGSYQFAHINNSARRGGVYVAVLTKTDDAHTHPIKVLNNDKLKNILSAKGPVGPALDDSGNGLLTANVIAPAKDKDTETLGVGGAFNIMDNLLRGGEFIQKAGLCPSASTGGECKYPLLTAYWEAASLVGTFYDDASNAIYVRGGGVEGGTSGLPVDTDEYDDTILLHEYGHFVAVRFAHDDSPGGPHNFVDNEQDIRLSWSEGWATFFASAVLNSPIIVDTNSRGTGLALNIETFSPPIPAFYTTSEASIGSGLWDLLDTRPNDDDPATTVDFSSIWKSFTTMVGAATMESFALQFMNQNAVHIDAFDTILRGRKIEFFPDAEVTALGLNVPQHHTLYQSGTNPFSDIDIVPFSVTTGRSYTVKTRQLTNGADTLLTINNSAGLELFSNDNTNGKVYIADCNVQCPKNDRTTLASSITFIATTTGTLFAHVKHSPAAPHSAGLGGSYDLFLTSP